MEIVKIKNIKTGIIKNVDKKIAGDFLGTKEWSVFKEEKEENSKRYSIDERKIDVKDKK